MYIMTFKI